MSDNQYLSNAEKRISCPICKSPWFTDGALSQSQDYLETFTTYACGAEVEWTIDHEGTDMKFKKNCPEMGS